MAGIGIVMIIGYCSLRRMVGKSLDNDTARVEREIAMMEATSESKEQPTHLPSLEDMESEELNEARGLPSSVLQDEEDE